MKSHIMRLNIRKPGEDEYDVGYGSYDLNNVISWFNECFEFCGKTKVASDNDGWIPVEEKRVPEKEVIAQNVYDEMMIGYVYYSEEMEWYECVSDDVYLTNVVAWQPLPESYKKHRQ